MSVENLEAAKRSLVAGNQYESLARVVRLLDAKDAEIERLKRFVDGQDLRSDFKTATEMRTEIERLKAQLAASEEKRRVLGEEVKASRMWRAWRSMPGGPDQWEMRQAWDEAMKATDAAKALEGGE